MRRILASSALRIILLGAVASSAVACAGPRTSAEPARGWTLLASLPTARSDLGAATGEDGRIYAVGGRSRGRFLSTVEVYNPARGTWEPAPPLPSPRASLTVVAGADGRIYALGGVSDSGILGTVEAYDPARRAWQSLAPLPTPRAFLAGAAGRDGTIYAIGGLALSGQLGVVEAYSPSTSTWAQLPPLPTPRRDVAAAAGADGRIYVIGGTRSTLPHPHLPRSPVATVEAYTPSTRSWTEIAPLPHGREGLAAVALRDGRIVALGGKGSVPPAADVEALPPGGGAWTGMPPLRVARHHLASVEARDGRIYALGGDGGALERSSPLGDVEALAAEPSLGPRPPAPGP